MTALLYCVVVQTAIVAMKFHPMPKKLMTYDLPIIPILGCLDVVANHHKTCHFFPVDNTEILLALILGLRGQPLWKGACPPSLNVPRYPKPSTQGDNNQPGEAQRPRHIVSWLHSVAHMLQTQTLQHWHLGCGQLWSDRDPRDPVGLVAFQGNLKSFKLRSVKGKSIHLRHGKEQSNRLWTLFFELNRAYSSVFDNRNEPTRLQVSVSLIVVTSSMHGSIALKRTALLLGH